MNEIFVAKNAFVVYLIISLVRPSVTTNGASSGAYKSHINVSSCWLLVPIGALVAGSQ